MTTRWERCKWCKARFVVPQEAENITCTRCGVMTQLPPRTNANAAVFNNGPRFGGFGNALKQGVNNLQRAHSGLQRAQTFIRAQLSPPNAYGPKRAVLCGITYKGNPKSLPGSVNDVMRMKKLLVETLGFPYTAVWVLTEDEKDPTRIPTKLNIRRALSWLVQGCQPGDSLVFHYSGHGSKVRDQHGDELDGHDECLCPVDYETEGRMLDDELNATIVRPLTPGVTLHAIIDTCYSGTFLDLEYLCKLNREGYYRWEDHRTPNSSMLKCTQGGLAICISACDDHQTSGDTTAFTGTASGALTYSFVQTLEKQQQKLTYGDLLIAMRNKVYQAQRAAGNWGPVQEPQLSTSEVFDVHLKKFII